MYARVVSRIQEHAEVYRAALHAEVLAAGRAPVQPRRMVHHGRGAFIHPPPRLQSKAFKRFFDTLTLNELLELCPDSAEYMRCFSGVHPVRELKKAFPGEHPLKVSMWACVLNDAIAVIGRKRCLGIVRKRRRWLYRALDNLLLSRGAERPPNFAELFRELEPVKRG